MMVFNEEMEQAERRAWAMELAVRLHEKAGVVDDNAIVMTAEYIISWVHHDASASPWSLSVPEPAEEKKW
jgi:hypothetical protein